MRRIFRIRFIIRFVLSITSIWSCTQRESETDKGVLASDKNSYPFVKTTTVNYGTYDREIITNGILKAIRRADLKFTESRYITDVYVSNGEYVKAGMHIAELDRFSSTNALNQAKEQLERAELEFNDILLKMGYNPSDTSRLPDGIIKSARVLSNYNKSLIDLELEEYKHNSLSLRSPIDGIVTNLFTKENNFSNITETFCSVIDDSEFEAEFSILESELEVVTVYSEVSIIPNSYEGYSVQGRVSRINPYVDSNGIIIAHAICKNKDKKLFEGMTVQVVIKQKIMKQLTVPNNAVLSKSGNDVVFIFKQGIAKWKSVKIGSRNTEYTIITGGLSPMDTVIVDGNLNLNNNSKVQLDVQ
jgi:membrane fusion protein, multidrug efflux system